MTNTPPKQVDEHYINTVLDAVAQKNKPLLGELLDRFPDMDEKTKTRTLFEISMAANDDVLIILSHLLSAAKKNAGYKQTLIDLLLDKSRTDNRFIIPFIDHANMAQLKSAVPLFATILLNETDTHILQKAIHAIGDTGEKSCINVIADFIFYDHDELKRAAIEALAKIGGPSVVKRLAFASKTSKSDEYLIKTLEALEANLCLDDAVSFETEKQFASKKDTLDSLADDSDIAQLICLLNSKSPHDRHLAIDSLIEIGPQVIPAVTENIDFSDSDSIINGLDILGNIPNETSLPSALKILNTKHQDSNVRFAAYETISKLPQVHSSVSLIDGISDPSEQVRIAAATAINHNLSDIVVSGLLSKIETSGRHSKRAHITHAIIDSHAGNIFSRLLGSDSFVFLATDYLSGCHEQTVSYFSDILVKRGTRSLARTIRDNVRVKENDMPLTIFCVDDSQICLKYYTKLFHSMGHVPFTFENPEEALTEMQKMRPHLVITDLNILGMNGLQLSEQIRETWSVSELPIVIITTQKDFKPQVDHINLVLHKPLEYKMIKPLIDKIH